jgi:hypothetical protein
MSGTQQVRRATLLAALALTLAAAGAAHAQWDITITNATANQVVSPPIVVSHTTDADLFEAGQPALDELAAVAEDADSAGLLALLETLPGVTDFAIAGDVLLPGDSVTLRIAEGSRLSAIGMLVTTNDTFFGLDSAKVDNGGADFYAPAYDAGSEKNTQRCIHIPGPPCDSPGVRVTEGAEGFVHISPGLTRRGSLNPRSHGWDNPVVKISVE